MKRAAVRMSSVTSKYFFCVHPRRGAAEARAHGIDENQVALLQPGRVVIRHLKRARQHRAVLLHDDPLGSQRAHVKPQGGGAGSAVKRKGQRPLRRGRAAILDVGHEKNIGFQFVGIVFERQEAGRRGIFERLSIDGEGMMRDRKPCGLR